MSAEPVAGQVMETLGRFDHHPDPAIDFCVEIEVIEGQLFEFKAGGFGIDPAALSERMFKASLFRVGGDEGAVAAMRQLRRMQDELASRLSPSPGEADLDGLVAKIDATCTKLDGIGYSPIFPTVVGGDLIRTIAEARSLLADCRSLATQNASLTAQVSKLEADYDVCSTSLHDTSKYLEAANDRVSKLEGKVEEAGKVIKPFAKEADAFDPTEAVQWDDTARHQPWRGVVLSDLRRARAFLKEID